MIKASSLIIALFFILNFAFAQSELIGSYNGVLKENNQAIIALEIFKSDSLIISGIGIYPDNHKFNFQGVVQNMNVDNSFITMYKALFQIQFFEDLSIEYEPSEDFIELTFLVEFESIEDENGMPEITNKIVTIECLGVWHSLSDMDSDNIEFQLIKQ